MNFNRVSKIALSLVMVLFVITMSNHMKNTVYRLEGELRTIKTNINKDMELIHVLQAEWSKLNNPGRLRKLASDHTSLNYVKAEQIINYSALPFDYEGDSRQDVARKNIALYAKNNRDIKKLASSRR